MGDKVYYQNKINHDDLNSAARIIQNYYESVLNDNQGLKNKASFETKCLLNKLKTDSGYDVITIHQRNKLKGLLVYVNGLYGRYVSIECLYLDEDELKKDHIETSKIIDELLGTLHELAKNNHYEGIIINLYEKNLYLRPYFEGLGYECEYQTPFYYQFIKKTQVRKKALNYGRNSSNKQGN